MITQNVEPPTSTQLLTIEEVAELLQVPKGWIYERTRTGTIPHLKLGKYLRFPLPELLQWLTEQSRAVNQIS